MEGCVEGGGEDCGELLSDVGRGWVGEVHCNGLENRASFLHAPAHALHEHHCAMRLLCP